MGNNTHNDLITVVATRWEPTPVQVISYLPPTIVLRSPVDGLQPGTRLRLEVTDDNVSSIVDAHVVGPASADDEHLWRLHIDAVDEHTQRRQHVRVPALDLELEVSLFGSGFWEPAYGFDISASGMRLSRPGTNEVGDLLQIRCQLPGPPEVRLDVCGEVMWVRRRTHGDTDTTSQMGVAFASLTDEIQRDLTRWVFERQRRH